MISIGLPEDLGADAQRRLRETIKRNISEAHKCIREAERQVRTWTAYLERERERLSLVESGVEPPPEPTMSEWTPSQKRVLQRLRRRKAMEESRYV